MRRMPNSRVFFFKADSSCIAKYFGFFCPNIQQKHPCKRPFTVAIDRPRKICQQYCLYRSRIIMNECEASYQIDYDSIVGNTIALKSRAGRYWQWRAIISLSARAHTYSTCGTHQRTQLRLRERERFARIIRFPAAFEHVTSKFFGEVQRTDEGRPSAIEYRSICQIFSFPSIQCIESRQ